MKKRQISEKNPRGAMQVLCQEMKIPVALTLHTSSWVLELQKNLHPNSRTYKGVKTNSLMEKSGLTYLIQITKVMLEAVRHDVPGTLLWHATPPDLASNQSCRNQHKTSLDGNYRQFLTRTPHSYHGKLKKSEEESHRQNIYSSRCPRWILKRKVH